MIFVLLIGVLVIMIIGLIFLFTRFKKLGGGKGKKSVITAVVLTLILAGLCVADMYFWIIAIIHLAFFWIVGEIIFLIVRKASGKKPPYILTALTAAVLTTIYLSIGWYFAHHVYVTEYTLDTDKEIPGGKVRIVQITDSHLGACFDGEGFAEHMKTVQDQSPDLVVVTGDFVDDGSCREDMEISCRALGELRTTYGVFFVYGNHDKGYYDGRDFTAEELAYELRANGVTILEDEAVPIGDGMVLIGRQDKSNRDGRADISDLVKDMDPDVYTVVLDHQPNDFDAESKAGVDLVLSGHTHGGQMIPLIHSGEWSGVNDLTYGKEVRGDTTFIVSSGIADWAVPFKTGCIAEIVVIDIV